MYCVVYLLFVWIEVINFEESGGVCVFLFMKIKLWKVWFVCDISYKRLLMWFDREFVYWIFFVFFISWIVFKCVIIDYYIVYYKIIKVMYLFRFG